MEQLREFYGDSFLRFVHTRDAAEDLTAGQQATVEVLADIAQASADQDDFARRINLYRVVCHYVPDSNATLAWALRAQSGGDMHPVDHEEKLTRGLLRLARDVWPAFLLPRPKEERYFGFPGSSTVSHPVWQALMPLLLEDDAIRRLFPGQSADVSDDNKILDIHSEVAFSTGHGGGLQLAMIPDMLITSARARQFAVGDPTSIDDYLKQVVRALGETRRLARGEEITVPKLVGLANMQIAEGVTAQTPFGVLRAPGERDELVLPRPTRRGGQVTAVLETVSPLKIIHRRSWQQARQEEDAGHYENVFAGVERFFTRGERNTTMVRYAALLASDETLFAPTQCSQTVFEPLNCGLSQSSAIFVPQPSGISTLDAAAAERLKSWAERIDQHHPANLDLGVRRLLSAVGVRIEPIDGFIDAVICWENMFGSTAESTFRICGAMASLLEPSDRTKRLALFDALKTLYGVRSKVVHGAKELSSRVASDYRTQSIERALDAMRRLYDHPELLTAKGSAERGRDVLLSLGLDLPETDANEPESLD